MEKFSEGLIVLKVLVYANQQENYFNHLLPVLPQIFPKTFSNKTDEALNGHTLSLSPDI